MLFRLHAQSNVSFGSIASAGAKRAASGLPLGPGQRAPGLDFAYVPVSEVIRTPLPTTAFACVATHLPKVANRALSQGCIGG